MILAALIPVFLMIVLGRLLAWRGFPGEGFWPLAERIIYYVMFPSLLFTSLVSTRFDAADLWQMMLVLYPPIVLVGLLLLLARPLLRWSGPTFTSVFQGGTRFNTYVGLAIAGVLFGPTGLATAALAIGVLVPFLNVLCVLALVVFGTNPSRGWMGFSTQILANPLIIACVLGLGVNFSGISIAQPLLETVGFLGRAALPMGLLAVGAGLQLRWARGDATAVLLASACKLILLPALVLALADAIRLDGLQTQAAVLFAALPTATAAFVLARQMGGDHELMARIITLETLLATLSLPWVISWIV